MPQDKSGVVVGEEEGEVELAGDREVGGEEAQQLAQLQAEAKRERVMNWANSNLRNKFMNTGTMQL
jgi:hypothetical protein